jgi:hypothetical protein
MIEAIRKPVGRDYSNQDRNDRVIERLSRLTISGAIIDNHTHRLYPYLHSNEQKRINEGGNVIVDYRGKRF